MNNIDLLNNSKPLLIFDGSCAFCRSCIRFIKKHDAKLQFNFADNKQIDTKVILTQHFINPENLNSIVLIENSRVHTQSDAVIKILLHLNGRWRLLAGILTIIPITFRNKVYKKIAANRIRLSSHCTV